MRFISVFSVLFMLISMQSGLAYALQDHPSQKANIALQKIQALPEVKEFIKHHKAAKPMLMVAREPEKNFKYYWIKLGTSNMDIFRTADDFYVNPNTFKIYYWDLMDSGTNVITLEQWRYWRTKPGFNRMHYYKAGKLIVLKEDNAAKNSIKIN